MGSSKLNKIPGYKKREPPRPIFETAFREELKANWGKKWGAQSAVRKLRKVLVHRPGDENESPLIEKDPALFNLPEGPPNLKKMQKQHDNFVDVMESEGVNVVYLDPNHPLLGTYDIPLRSACYTHESVIIDGGAIIGRPAPAYKKGLEVFHTKRLVELGCPILFTVQGKSCFEASNLWFIDSETVIIARGLRTNIEGINQIKPILKQAGVEEIHITQLPGYLRKRKHQVGGSSGIFHLDMAFGMADVGLGVLYPGGVDYNTIRFLEEEGINLIEVPEEELRNCAPNILPLAPGKVIIPSGNEKTIKNLRREGVDTIEVDLSEFVKGGGGPRCMALPLIRD